VVGFCFVWVVEIWDYRLDLVLGFEGFIWLDFCAMVKI
jgi:hypothetical protein